jgi:XRE family aerobic/anaerobic benzoate catabolism transcriptional regulator
MTDLPAADKDPFLSELGERVKSLRARRGITRKELARLADVSERHVANVEAGVGNASIQFLRQLAQVLDCGLAEITGDETASSPEWKMIREILRGRSEVELAQARAALSGLFSAPAPEQARRQRIALIGLRGAGKTTLGRMLADTWSLPFVELAQEIEALAGCGIGDIHALYGDNAYRRHQFRALEQVIRRHPTAVIATPGEIVCDTPSFDLLLAHCHTVWLKAAPGEHLARVLGEKDRRALPTDREALEDMKSMLASREGLHAKADMSFDTSGMGVEAAFLKLVDRLRLCSR